MPKSLYFELATWSTINFTYTLPERARCCSSWSPDSREPEKVARLLKTIRAPPRPPHRVRGRGRQDRAQRRADADRIALDFLEAGLAAPATRAGFDARDPRARPSGSPRSQPHASPMRASSPTPSRRSSSPAARAACRPCARRLPRGTFGARRGRIGFSFRCVRPDARGAEAVRMTSPLRGGRNASDFRVGNATSPTRNASHFRPPHKGR